MQFDSQESTSSDRKQHFHHFRALQSKTNYSASVLLLRRISCSVKSYTSNNMEYDTTTVTGGQKLPAKFSNLYAIHIVHFIWPY